GAGEDEGEVPGDAPEGGRERGTGRHVEGGLDVRVPVWRSRRVREGLEATGQGGRPGRVLADRGPAQGVRGLRRNKLINDPARRMRRAGGVCGARRMLGRVQE